MPDGLQRRELTIYKHIERLGKGNNRVEMVWVPSQDDSLTMSCEARDKPRRQPEQNALRDRYHTRPALSEPGWWPRSCISNGDYPTE
ncbi:Uncharacterized protein HZ326_29450 [Fusarium oxysporum f. sp. albedinis]|nr:Uncharacterized protein HZ326_29450 [Fusarium oxysporum f. sp. albedinis]